VDVFGPTSLCGDGPALDGKPRFTAGQATRDSTFLRFDARDLPSIFKLDTNLPLSLLQISSIKLRVVAARLQFLGSSSVQDRIAETLLRLASNFEDGDHSDGLVRTRLSHAKLAAMTGTTRVSVTRTLKRLRESGVIAVEPDGLLRIVDSEKLQAH
jgi:CRP/FNR family cyclic AMP-dependent transcriptional regulator